MRFTDEVKIQIIAGHGGKGAVSFRRETFVPRGGPDGGEGGRGGDVIFEASENLTTLQDFRVRRIYRGKNGEAGSGRNRSGRAGLDQLVKVPVGTQFKDQVTGELLVDLATHGAKWVACKGGRGGKGNAHFVSSTFQAPRFAQPGEEGEVKELKLELKLIADVGLLGLPNAGKSTLISRISGAAPKIADYPFTTLSPVLGVVRVADDAPDIVVADIPGLIEGAHQGMGLGHEFLRHVSRTRCLVHLVSLEELAATENLETTLNNIRVIENELHAYDPTLLERPRILVPTKTDLFAQDDPVLEGALATLRESYPVVLPISAVSGNNVRELVAEMGRLCFSAKSETMSLS